MASSGAKPGRLPESALAIQIDTIQFHLGTRVSHGLPRFFHSFNRTVVMKDLKKITTVYVASEDRIRLSGEVADGQPVTLWLTQRLLNRLVPQLLHWLERQTAPKGATSAALVRGEALQHFAQQAARAKRARQVPVNAAAAGRGWLVVSVNMSANSDGVRLVFRGQGSIAKPEGCDGISMSCQAQPLRQWLDIVYRHYQKSAWALTVWPDWVRDSAADEPRSDVMLH
jgi:hypothetical protein